MKNYTDITIILDRSGSMASIKKDTIGGFNSFVDDQKKDNPTAKLSLVQFDHEYKIDYDGEPIQEIKNLSEKTFQPRGSTALYDAMGKAINAAGDRFSSMEEQDRPEKVIFVIMTDGGENSSFEFTGPEVQEMVGIQQKTYSWEFIFLGASPDFEEVQTWASSVGIRTDSCANYLDINTTETYGVLSDKVTSFSRGLSASMDFSLEEKEALTRAKK